MHHRAPSLFRPGSGTRARRTLFTLLLALVGPLGVHAGEPAFSGPKEVGRLQAPPRKETSGIAASRRMQGVFWVHDDSGGQPVLYAVEENGRLRGTIRVKGTKNDDWEDVASCELDGKPWLVVGDVGDNDAERSHVLVHFVEEPGTGQLNAKADLAIAPAFTLRIVYEDGPRDCESLAVDSRERMVYLLSKRDRVPRLYRVPVAPATDGRPITAQFVGEVSHIPQPSAAQSGIKGHLGRRRAEVCAMDFSTDGRGAVVLTYGSVLYYPRGDGETWPQALAREPQVLPGHDLPQAEAACFSTDDRAIYVASESTPKLIRYERR